MTVARLLCCLCLCWLTSAYVADAAEPVLVINSSFETPITSPDQSGVLDRFYQALGQRAGVRFEIQAMSAERGLRNANNGIDDGDVSRVFGIDQTYTNLVRVPEPVMAYQMVVFTRHANFTVNGGASLRPYDVGILTGWKILERNIVDARSLTKLETGEQLFNMLDKNRIDVAVIEKLEGQEFVRRMQLKGIRILQPPFVQGDWYLYLNKKHQALLPRLNAAILAMKADGSYQKIFDEANQRYKNP